MAVFQLFKNVSKGCEFFNTIIHSWNKFFSGPLNGDDDKKWQKITYFKWKNRLKNYFWTLFWACMNWNFNVHQFSTNFDHILHIFREKIFNWFFTWFSPFFHRQVDFRKLHRPSESDFCGFHGGIPFSWVPGSPQNHYWKKIFQAPKNPKIPNPLSQPSVQWFLRKRMILKLCDTKGPF